METHEIPLFKIELGVKVRDKISGLVGIVTSRTEYFNGCLRYGVQAKAKAGKVPDAEWTDEKQLEVIGHGVSIKKKRTGGPMPAPQRESHP